RRASVRAAEHLRRLLATGAAGYPDGVLARRRADTKRLRRGELYRRTRNRGEAGPRRVPARSSLEESARQGRAGTGRRTVRLGTGAAQGARPGRVRPVRVWKLHGAGSGGGGRQGR